MRLRPGPLRDAIVLVVVFGFLLGGLYAYTGTWPPAVIVESSSMMHPDAEVTYGRFGTIDPGDLVLVKDVDAPEDVRTLVEGGKERYGSPGDVIVYFPFNDQGRTPIIHRAVAYVEVVEKDGATEYRMRWDPDAACEGGARKEDNWCVYGAAGVYAPSVPIARPGSTQQNPQPYKPEHSGFLTKGDNPSTNRNIDQVSGLSPTVDLEWVEGKGRGELPWLGLIKLALAGKQNERSPPDEWARVGSAYAPKDLWVMLGLTLFVLVGIPLIYDGWKAIEARRRPPAPPAPANLRAIAQSATAVHVTWNALGEGPPSNFRIYRDGALLGSTGTDAWLDETAEPGRSYSYTVSAVDAMGEDAAQAGPVEATTPQEGEGDASDAEPTPPS